MEPRPAKPVHLPHTPGHHHAPPPRRRWWAWVGVGILVLIVLLAVAAIVWYSLEIRPAKPKAATPITFQLASGTGLTTTAHHLKQAGIIRSAPAFTLYVVAKGQRHALEAGTYDLNPGDSVTDITNTLTHGKIAQNTLVVPEGTTVAKLGTLAAHKGISSAAFNAALSEGYVNTSLSARPAGDSSLEGYLFPDSYELGSTPSAHTLIQNMLTNFTQRVNQANLVPAYAREGLTLHQGLTLASIVEREAKAPQDRPIIAQVFLKRLAIGMPLESDVTVDYASQLTGLPFSTTLNSPYNTYAQAGLPPGPICNPGLSTMEAVAHPAATNYLYFIADKNGVVHYAQTAQEHEANVQKYLGGQ